MKRNDTSGQQQLWWVMPIEGGVVVQQLMCSEGLAITRMVASAIKHFSKTQLPEDPLHGILVCCGVGNAHPVSVFTAVGKSDGWEYYTCPLCEVSYRKESEDVK